MMEYKAGNAHYIFSYQDVREKHLEFCRLSDMEFIRRLPEVIHLAVFICFVKEIPSYVCLADNGIIHELVHLLALGTLEPLVSLKDIRNDFKTTLKLA
jgi:hypothetical protein